MEYTEIKAVYALNDTKQPGCQALYSFIMLYKAKLFEKCPLYALKGEGALFNSGSPNIP